MAANAKSNPTRSTTARLLMGLAVAATPLVVAVAGTQALGTAAGATTAPGPNSVVAFGAAATSAAPSSTALPGPTVGIGATPDGNGYWTVTSSGTVTSRGTAHNFGSLSGNLNAPVLGIAATGDGAGYWLVAADGGIFSFGDAAFHGSTGAMTLNRPVVGMASTPDGGGYWLVASDGGIFAFGDAQFYGSTGAMTLAQPIVGMASTSDGKGYWLVASDGGIFAFGDAPFYGSGTGGSLVQPVVGMASRPGGYWLAYGQTAPLNTPLGQEQVLAGLGYLPLSWSPNGFVWRWGGSPASLMALWSPGQYNVILKGAIMAFESNQGLTWDGVISAPEIAALQAAANSPSANQDPHPYGYVYVNQNLPETATVYTNGQQVYQTLANTGQPGATTQVGTFPVYLRFLTTTMTGTNPNGSHYSDPGIPWVSYFNGGDALHGFVRAHYGYPQSDGCVEMPPANAAVVFPLTPIGTLVTVN